MKILVHDYAGHPFQVQLARELARRGHHVLHAYAAALQTPRGDLTRKADDPDTFEIREVPMAADYVKYKYSFARRRQMEIAYGHEVARLVEKFQPDVVISSNTPTETQEPIQAATHSCEAEFIYWVQDFYSIAVDKLVRKKIPLLGAVIGAYYKKLERRQLQRSQHVVAITDDFAPIMVQQFGVARQRITTIPNWAPIEQIPTTPKKNDWSSAHGLENKFVYLYTGTLGMKHNPDLLLQLAIRNKETPNVSVVVISEGLGADWLKQKKSELGLENLLLLPYQPFHVLPEVLGSGDVLVAVLEEDAGVFSVPSKVLTYLCAGRPLLLAVPAVNLAARIIDEVKAGMTVAPSDGAGFQLAAEMLRQEKGAATRMARNARVYAEKHFRITDIAARFESILCAKPALAPAEKRSQALVSSR